MAIHISIHLFATLANFQPDNADKYPIEPGTSVQDILIKLRVPLEDVRLVFINGVKGAMGSIPQDGDRVGVFPPVGGG